jgi:CRISPR-associated protein Cst2
MLGAFLAVEPVRVTEDFGVMSRGISDPVLHAHEFYTADLAAPFLLDVPRIGTFTLPSANGVGKPNYLTEAEARKMADAVAGGAAMMPGGFRGQQALRLPLPARRERAAILLEALGDLAGGAKKALHYGDRTPALVAVMPMAGGVNPLGFVIDGAEDGSGLRVRADVLRQELDAWQGEWEAPVRFGWRPGFRELARKQFESDLGALADPRFWEWVACSALLHDAGKIADGFQRQLRPGGQPWGERHEVLSLAYADLRVRPPVPGGDRRPGSEAAVAARQGCLHGGGTALVRSGT